MRVFSRNIPGPLLQIFLALAVFFLAITVARRLQPNQHAIRSQNGYYHLGMAAASNRQLPATAQALSDASPHGRFVDQHALYHRGLALLARATPGAPALNRMSELGLGLLAIALFLLLLPQAGPWVAATGALAIPLLSLPAFLRFMAGRPAAFSMAFLAVLVAVLLSGRRSRILWASVVVFFWAGFGYTSLLALPIFFVLAGPCAALIGTVAWLVGLLVWVGPHAPTHLWATLSLHLRPGVQIFEWRAVHSSALLPAIALVFFAAIAWKIADGRRLRRLSLFALLLACLAIAVSRLSEAAVILSASALVLAWFESSTSRARRIFVGLGLALTTCFLLTRARVLPETDGSYFGDPLPFLAEVSPRLQKEKVLSLDWTLWSAAFYLDPETRLVPGFSPVIARSLNPRAWRIYDHVMSDPKAGAAAYAELTEQWGTRLVLMHAHQWRQRQLASQGDWKVHADGHDFILAEFTGTRPPRGSPKAFLPVRIPEVWSPSVLCPAYLSSLKLLESRASAILKNAETSPHRLVGLRSRLALVSMCARPDLKPRSHVCDEVQRHFLRFEERLQGDRTLWAADVILLALWLDEIGLTLPPERQEALEKLVRSFDDGERVITRKTRLGDHWDQRRDVRAEIFASGHYALWLARKKDLDRERFEKLAKTYAKIYRTEFGYSVYFLRWWGEALGLYAERTGSAAASSILLDLHHGVASMQGPDGCLGPQIPEHPRFVGPHHVSGLVLEGLWVSRRLKPSWWSPRFEQLHEGLLRCSLGLQEVSGTNAGLFRRQFDDDAFYPDVQGHLTNALAGVLPAKACKDEL